MKNTQHVSYTARTHQYWDQQELDAIRKDFLDNVTLAVQPQEELQAKKIHHKIFVVSGDNIGFANTIKDVPPIIVDINFGEILYKIALGSLIIFAFHD